MNTKNRVVGGRRISCGFTLIELLVVIAIIALLLSIILPSLKEAKKRAMSIYCLANLRTLSMAWTTYAGENDSNIVSGEAWNNPASALPYDWVHPVIATTDPEYTPGMSDHERELAGIRKSVFYSYTTTEKIYNCPGDRTWKDVTGPLSASQSPFRSFAVPWTMNGGWGGIDVKYKYTKITEIPSPSSRLVFLEEEEAGGSNWGSWILPANPGTFTWWDPIAVWHSKSSTDLGFADGHAERHFWKDQSTMYMAETQTQGVAPNVGAGEGEDLRYMRRIYHHAFK